MSQYDVFVSYRRTSFESANLISEKMRAMGYSVFFDVETLRSGNFNEQLFKVIGECTDFVLVLPPDALERCSDENDWVRKEVMYAIEHKKNIVPVMLHGFEWPAQMPQGMEVLSQYQCIKAGEQEFFDLSMKRLASYLISKPHKNLRNFYKKIACVVLALLIVAGGAYTTLNIMSKKLCSDISMSVSSIVSNISSLRQSQSNYYKLWEEYCQTMQNPVYRNPQDMLKFTRIIQSDFDQFEKDVDSLKNGVVMYTELTSFEKFLVGMQDVDPQDIFAFNPIYDSFINNMKQFIMYVKMMTHPDINEFTATHINLMYRYNQHFINTVYCSYLNFLNEMPAKAKEHYYELLGQNLFANFTVQAELGKDEKEYEAIQNAEMAQIQKCMQEMAINNEKQKAFVEQQEKMLKK